MGDETSRPIPRAARLSASIDALQAGQQAEAAQEGEAAESPQVVAFFSSWG
jgi:hypothetical protein